MVKKENQNVEYKQVWRDEFLKTICAFANAKGGILYIGINDIGEVVGTENIKKLLEDIPNKIVDILGVIAEVNSKKRNDKEYIIVKVKPYDTPISYRGKYYVRSGSTTQEQNGAELQKFLLNKSKMSWESVIEERADINDIDQSTILKFKELAIKRDISASREKSIILLLEKLHLLVKGKLTRAAVLLFGKDPQKFYPNSFIKIGRFKDEVTILSMDEVYGNLFKQAEGSMEILKKKYLQTNTSIDSLHRKEELEYPEIALREAIINAIVHRDYSAFNTQFKIYPDQFSLWNNGELTQRLTIEKLRQKHSSFPKNELIANVFYKATYIEAWGHGTVKMIYECKKAKLPEPLYQEDSGGIMVTFRKNTFTMEYFKKMNLNERQLKAVLYVKENGSIVNSMYQAITMTTKKTATRDLLDLVIKKIFENKGKTKGAIYILKDS